MLFDSFTFKDWFFLIALVVGLAPIIRDLARAYFKRSKVASTKNPFWVPRFSKVINREELLKRPPIPPRMLWNTNTKNPPGGGRMARPKK